MECAPGLLLEFLETLPQKDERTRLSFILQSGFAEGCQLRCGEEFLQKLPEYLSVRYGGCLVKGDNFGIRLLEGEKREQVTKPYQSMGAVFTEGDGFLRKEAKEFTGPEIFPLPIRLLLQIIFKTFGKKTFQKAAASWGCNTPLDRKMYQYDLIACMIFAAMVLPTLYKDPIQYIMSYPPAIRKRVESLPEYKSSIQSTEKKHIAKKYITVFVYIILLSAVACFSGAQSFETAFVHVFILFLSVNLFDVIVLDIGVFCHSKKLRIAGTEDMDKDYKDYLFHVKGAVLGMVLGTVISLLSACLVHIVSRIGYY